MASRIIPPLLEPYLALPDEAALVVLTGILGASTNWLVLRHLHSLLKPTTTSTARHTTAEEKGSSPNTPGAAAGETETSVLLLSFLRDFSFWKDGASRLGLDLDGLGRRGRFAFVDGLGGLFTGGGAAAGQGQGQQHAQKQQQQQPQPHANVRRGVSGTVTATATGTGIGTGGRSWDPKRWTLTSPAVADVGRTLHAAIDELQARSSSSEGRVVLVVDQLDFLLAAAAAAAAGDGSSAGVSGLALRELLLDLREKTHATILTLSADEPLITTPTTTLERGHASFVLALAHEAQTVVSLRLLDTGTAKDVSGVMRITGGGDDSGTPVEEKEYLYHVGGDGGVRIFERGQ